MNVKLLKLLICPLCKSKISYEGKCILCKKCKSEFEVIDGIPVMLINKEIKNSNDKLPK